MKKLGQAIAIALLLWGLGVTVSACSVDTVVDHTNQENEKQNEETNQENEKQNEETNQENQNHTDVDPEFSEAFQVCAAAGQVTGGAVTAIHCFSPHDVSGFQANNDAGTQWRPGAFHVIAE